jgi:hypothetical protein
MSTDHLYKSGVAESNGDVISGLPHPLVTETTSGQILENHKNLKNSETGGDRQENIQSLKTTISDRPIEWSYYFRLAAPPDGDFRFRSVFTPSKSANNSKTVCQLNNIKPHYQCS